MINCIFCKYQKKISYYQNSRDFLIKFIRFYLTKPIKFTIFVHQNEAMNVVQLKNQAL